MADDINVLSNVITRQIISFTSHFRNDKTRFSEAINLLSVKKNCTLVTSGGKRLNCSQLLVCVLVAAVINEPPSALEIF